MRQNPDGLIAVLVHLRRAVVGASQPARRCGADAGQLPARLRNSKTSRRRLPLRLHPNVIGRAVSEQRDSE